MKWKFKKKIEILRLLLIFTVATRGQYINSLTFNGGTQRSSVDDIFFNLICLQFCCLNC